MAVTLQQWRDIFYAILRETESDVSAYPTTLADLFLNAAQDKICKWMVINRLTWQTAKKWVLPFINTDKFYSNIATTSLTAAATVWWSTLSATTTNYPSSGSLYIHGNIITYTGKTSTQFTGCSNILFAFPSWTQVSAVFDLPSDFASSINLVFEHKVKVPNKQYDDFFEDLNRYKWDIYSRNRIDSYYEWVYKVLPFYTIKDNAYMIVYNLNNTGDELRLRYEKKATEMATTSDTFTISDDTYAKVTVPYLAVAEMLYNRWEEERAAQLYNHAISWIQEMYNYYNSSSSEKISWKQYRVAKSGSLLNL